MAIIITSYNDGRFLDESLGSALDLIDATTGPVQVQLLIADDGSTERRTVDVLNRLERQGHPLLRWPHRELGATRNAAISQMVADWFIPLDADNRLRPSLLNRVLPLVVGDATAAMVYGDAMRFGDRHDLWQMGPTDVARLWKENHIDSCAVVRRSAWDEVGHYSERQNGVEDWDLWLRFLEHGMDLRYSPGLAFDCRVRADSLINRLTNTYWSAAATPLSELHCAPEQTAGVNVHR